MQPKRNAFLFCILLCCVPICGSRKIEEARFELVCFCVYVSLMMASSVAPLLAKNVGSLLQLDYTTDCIS